ncbi:MAG: ATP-binding protein [Kiritimatiellae bacterium]|nr:ATP-binding protein [Kiritimatiellia bacterium]
MQHFKNNISDGWLFRQELRSFRNFMRNWDEDISDCDFFDIFANGMNSSRTEIAQFLKDYFTLDELAKIESISVCHDGKKPGNPITDIVVRRDVDITLCDVWNVRTMRKRCREMLEELCGRMERRKTRVRRHKDLIEMRVDEICRVLRLDDVERDVLIYSIVRTKTCFDDFPIGGVRNGRHDLEMFYAMAIDRPVSVVGKAMSASGRLRKFGVLDSDGDIPRGSFRSYIEAGDGDMLEGEFYKKLSSDDALPWEYYGKLADEHGGILRQMIASAKSGARGVNILFYGEPGTGKTSFAKTLAKELGLDLYEIRQGDRDGERNLPQSRMAGIRICNEQVPRERSMVVVDEADQLLRTNMDFFASMFGGIGSSGSEKGVINSILDETKLPTIWISNAPARALDDSVRRRFDYSIRFDKLGTRQRSAIWRNSVKKHRLERLVPESLSEQLAQKYQTSAGGIAMVLENVKRMRPRKDRVAWLIDSLMKPHCELMEAKAKVDTLMPAKDYSLEGLNIKGDIALDRIVDAVRRFRSGKDDGNDPDRPRMNLLLWGPPGTGKTEFVKHLGKTLNAKVSVRMGSDLLSCWVGMTEKNIKTAFEEAEADNAILFLDEIDGIVQDRSGAQRSWEVTQVNELLHQMENFRGVMVGATNFMDNLDAAIMRRFTFKLQFDYLEGDGKRLFFERMFKTRLSEAEATRLAEITNLAPGDFRTVRQSLYYLGGTVTNAMRLSELEKESSLKKGASRRIGF